MSDHRFDNFLFRSRVDSCVSKIRLILDSNKAAALGTADMVSHTYEDKYQLANYLTNTAAACSLNCLRAFGMDEARLKMAKQWSQDKDVSLVLHVNESCEYLCEKTREEDSTSKVVVETTFLGKISSKVVNTITEHFYRFKVSYEISLVRGLGVNNEDKISLQSRKASQDICLRAKNMPYLEKNTRSHSVNISWLMRHLDEKLDTMTFSIDRTHKDCHTPARNDDVKTAEKFFHDLDGWVAFVSQYFTNTLIPIQVNHEPNCKIDISQLTSAEVFVPVVPLFNSVPDQPTAAVAVPSIEDGSEQPTSASSSSPETAVVPAATNGQQLIVSASLLNQLLAEESRSLTEKCTQMRTLLPLPTATALTSCAEGAVLVVCTHLKNVIAHYLQGIQFIEHMLRQQLIAAVGKELQPSDFSEYMRFHNRKIFREQYLPAPFTHSVRRSALHSPEGTVRIEESRSGDAIYTVCRSSAASGNVMEFPLNAATKVKFGGERHLHAWLAHSFSGQSVGELKLVAQARQFSSFIVLIGRIAGPTLFEPKHGFIVQNKDEMSIPLWLEQIPTPKEFKDAIESLSPEQKRFAQAFRSMQLESTLFGVCVIQIKPQLEKVLKLSPDSLTKEIQLTQDLMKLFIEYQIPTDLMSFEGAADAGVSERLEKVRGHVAAMNGMLKAAKEAEIEQKNNERLYTYGSADPFGGLPPPPVAAFSGFGAAPGSQPRMMFRAAGGAPPAPPASVMSSAAFAPASFSAPATTVTSSTVASAVLCMSSPLPVAEVQQPQHQQQKQQRQEYTESSEHSGEDFTQYPTLLDKNYEKHDPDSALRPTIIKVGESWTKKAQAALLTAASTKTLYATDQTAEKTAAFDLLDALSRSGALTIEDASLHVVIAATHCFDKSLMSTVVQKNVNPIERVERSTLIMASTIHGAGAADLVVGSQVSRLQGTTPSLFLTNA